MNPKPISTMISALTPIWQRALERPSIRVDDNFFDLGGDPSLAIKIFAEIAQVCGRELPPLMIYQAPTIATLAALLAQPTPPRLSRLVRLKAGTQAPPVFIAHGLGGSVMELFQLVKHIRSRHPIYGTQAKGMDGVDEPLACIEDMALFYLQAIKALQPHGPYLLIGYSLGGLVVLEIARRLSRNGEKVALLAMLDTYPHQRHLSPPKRVRLVLERARHRTATLMQSPMRELLSHALRRQHISGDASGSTPWRTSLALSRATAIERVRDGDYLAWTLYRPRFYSGKIKFVRAESSFLSPNDPAVVWANLSDEFEIETLPGDHLGIMTTHFESAASALSRYLQEACCSESEV